MTRNSGLRPSSKACPQWIQSGGPRRSSIAFLLSFLVLLLILSSCHGKNKNSPSNVGGGYTLLVSGGTLNDGSGVNGLSVLATLRDSNGMGPTNTWFIDITGPGISPTSPLSIDYESGWSYMGYEWGYIEPAAGANIYRATATNPSDGTVIHYDFSINSASVQARPAPSAGISGDTITLSWEAVNAASYYYEVCPPSSTLPCETGFTTALSASITFAGHPTGDYLIRVRAYSTDRAGLSTSSSPSPTLASQENVSEYAFSFPVGTTVNPNNIDFKASVGVMDYGLGDPSGPVYGLVIWTSVTENNAAPAGNWNIIVTDPNDKVFNFIYPAGATHYVYWYYGIEPVSGTYDIQAVYISGSVEKPPLSLTLSDTTPRLNLPTITGALSDVSGNVTVSWNAVTGAASVGSYYVNIWAEVWNNNQWDYREVGKEWVNAGTLSTIVTVAPYIKDNQYDVYVTACEVDMTAAPPSTAPRVDMSENYNPYSFVAL